MQINLLIKTPLSLCFDLDMPFMWSLIGCTLRKQFFCPMKQLQKHATVVFG